MNLDVADISSDPEPKTGELFEQTFDVLATPALLIDAEGMIIRSNRAFSDLVGLDVKLLSGTVCFSDYVLNADRLRFRSLLASAFSSKQYPPKSADLRMTSKKTETRFVGIHLSKLPDRDLMVATLLDRADFWRAEDDIKRKTEDLESLFYLISHNLKSPLVSIQGFVNLMLDSRQELKIEDTYHYLERIKVNAGQLNMMVQDILEFSRAANRAPQIQDVDLGELFHSIHSEMLFKIKERHINFQVPDNPPILKADKDGLQTIFRNLVDNSIKYIGENDSPTVAISLEDKGRFYAFCVKDNGIGIAERDQERVMKLFERVEKGKEEGTGVGLPIVARLVEKHSGMLRLVSAEGVGTSVYFTLPKEIGGAESS